jgi:hypothetical protein
MHQRYIKLRAQFGQIARAGRVDGIRPIEFVFRPVDEIIGRCVDHQFRLQVRDDLVDLPRNGDINCVAAQRNDLT